MGLGGVERVIQERVEALIEAFRQRHISLADSMELILQTFELAHYIYESDEQPSMMEETTEEQGDGDD